MASGYGVYRFARLPTEFPPVSRKVRHAKDTRACAGRKFGTPAGCGFGVQGQGLGFLGLSQVFGVMALLFRVSRGYIEL